MVFLQRSTAASARKRSPPPSSPENTPPSPPPTLLGHSPLQMDRSAPSSTTNAGGGGQGRECSEQKKNHIDRLVSVLADAGCTLSTSSSAPPSLLADPHKLRCRLESRFSSEDGPALTPYFLSGLSHYIRDRNNLRRLLSPVTRDGGDRLPTGESLIRILLLVPPIQLQLQCMLLEKLPEHFDEIAENRRDMSLSLENDVSRLIINQFRWLDFLVDPEVFSDKLMEVLSICPLPLKKEIIGSLPEIIGDRNNEQVVSALERMLQEDLDVIVPVLDSLSNLNLDEQLQEQAISIALSCIRTVDADHMPHLLRFLLLSSTPKNTRRIISQIRDQLQFVAVLEPHSARNKKLKGKTHANSAQASILEALRSSLQFKNMLCEDVLKELKSLSQPHDHKVIDLWLLMLIYTNGGSLQKSAEKVLRTKIIEGCFQESLFDQCIHGHRDLVKDYFSEYLAICEHLLACKEKQARESGTHIYTSLFEEFTDTYSRQEILGALVAHIGSGIGYEVNSALETMVLLTSKYSHELIPVSSHINGILDYLEGFTDENLRKVYEVFCHLACYAQSNTDSVSLSIANELLMIVRKQVGNPDMRYRKMGIIGTLKLVSMLGNVNSAIKFSSSQKSNIEEALELLKMCLESCRSASLPLILLYEELIALLESTTPQPAILEWLGKHVGEFESVFLADLEGGKLPTSDSSICLEGELWMNLDGDLSPICLDILQLLSSSQKQRSSTLQILPAQFLLLSAVERSANQGSLGGIDALLGCPVHLPSQKYFSEPLWKSLNGTQKKMLSLSLYYAINWIRELINAFSTQVCGRVDCLTQATREEIISKLLKRLRNLICMESLLNSVLKVCPLSLPELHNYTEWSGCPCINKSNNSEHAKTKHEFEALTEDTPLSNKRKCKKKSKALEKLDADGKLRQPTILDVLKRAGVPVSQEIQSEGSASSSSRVMSQSTEHQVFSSDELGDADISAVPSLLESQRFKFRPLQVDCLSILSFSQGQDSCCSDSAAELPLHLYLLRDFHYKLEYLNSSGRSPMTSPAIKAPPGLNRMMTIEFLNKVRPLFASLKKHLDVAVCVIKGGAEICQEHWSSRSTSAGNPDIASLMFSKSSAANFVCREILHCYRKLLNLPDLFLHSNMPILRNLLEAFQPNGEPAGFCLGVHPLPAPGNMDYLYCGTCSFLENIMDISCSFSFSLASEVLFTLESVLNSVPLFINKVLEGNGKKTCIGFSQGVYPYLQRRLGTSAHKLLVHDWNNHDNSWKSKGDLVQKILHIYLNNSESTSNLLVDLACSVLPQVPFCKSRATQDVVHGFPTLCPIMFVNWYRVLHEVNLAVLTKLIREIVLVMPRGVVQLEAVKEVLIQLRQFVDVIVSLTRMCRTHDKVIVHVTATKYGGKFLDIFLKTFDFLEAHFQMHNDIIIQMVKELQKATRIIQTLCSEAKGSRRTMVTSKIPATKRSLERFLFRVKALFHSTSNGCSFWMGNLKHKDLLGQEVSSQVYMGGEDDAQEAHSPEEADHMDTDS